VPHVGHCHPHVVEAICKQSATLNLHTRYLHENVVRYAERLTATLDPSLSTMMFTCTGTESNELALRMARYKSGGRGIIVSDFSYHGNSETLASVTTCFPTPEPFPDFARNVPIPDPYRDREGRSDEELGDLFAGYVADAIRSLQSNGIQLAALLIDASFANEGLPEPVPGYVAKAVALVREAGGALIADEVQCGFGRTGEAMWGYQLAGVVPDFVTMGKPMGNGYPVGGVAANGDLVDSFGLAATYFNTFGGNPVSAAAGMAVLDVIEQENLLENAKTVGAYVRAGLNRLMAKHDIIGNVRGRGLFFGLELVTDRAAKTPAGPETRRMINMMRDRGVLVSRIGRYDNILKMRPAMVFGVEHADLLLSTLDDALAAL
jgi:4-aminobutyrate aminotransferase-like enzyme